MTDVGTAFFLLINTDVFAKNICLVNIINLLTKINIGCIIMHMRYECANCICVCFLLS